MEDRLDNNAGSQSVNNSNIINNIDHGDFSAFVLDKKPEQPFKSRFKTWLRTIALLVVLVFVPEQISWALSYDPRVLWGAEKFQAPQENPLDLPFLFPEPMTAEELSLELAKAMRKFLGQVAYRDNPRVNIYISDTRIEGGKMVGKEPKKISLETKLRFDENSINIFPEI